MGLFSTWGGKDRIPIYFFPPSPHVISLQSKLFASDFPLENSTDQKLISELYYLYEGWNFNSGNYLFTTDTK